MFKEYKGVIKALFTLFGVMLLCRINGGLGAAVVVLAGIYFSTKKRHGALLLTFMYLPFLTVMSSILVSHGGGFGMVARAGTPILTILMALQAGGRRGNHGLPLGVLYFYLICALVSSIDGWLPMVSYLKLFNFLTFLGGIHLGTKNLQDHPKELETVRNGLLAFAIFVLLGSIISIAIPSLGYSMEVARAQTYNKAISKSEAIERLAFKTGIKLFSGVLNHSQTLAPTISCAFCWVVLDMIFCEKKLDKLHLLLIAVTPILLYKTRSRTGLISFVAGAGMAYFYALAKVKIPAVMKRKITSGVTIGVVLLVGFAIVAEVNSGAMTKWLRKTDNIEGDQRGISEALSATRQGKIEDNLYDFRKRPTIGMGFQVSPELRELYQLGEVSLFSAPIEKGVMPLMVLGETGVLGAMVFAVFLIVFYSTCMSKRYVATSVLFTVLLMLNMGEATFFSPGGAGGCFWIVTVVGGYAIDMYVVAEKRKMARVW